MHRGGKAVIGLLSLLCAAMPGVAPGWAASFDAGSVNGALDTQLTLGLGLRTSRPDCALTGDVTTSCGASANEAQSSAADNGDLNYRRGQLFTAYAKVTPELLLHFPDQQVEVMARGSFSYDAAAAATRRTELGRPAQDQLVRDGELYDLWIGKGFDIGEHSYRLRLGNQVINWGESLFLYGGINATNAIDYQKSLIPGAQVKEYVLPAPMVSLAGNPLAGVTMEAYYQLAWNASRFPPVGGYWSAADIFGRGDRDIYTLNAANPNQLGLDPATLLRLQGASGRLPQGRIAALSQQILDGGAFGQLGGRILPDGRARDQGQFGLSAHWKPAGSVIDTGVYYLHYHDKAPVLDFITDMAVSAGGDYQARYRNDRDLFGLSTNFPLGNWAIGGELSYRPRDAVSLSACYLPGAPLNAANAAGTAGAAAAFADGQACPQWRDMQKVELHLTGMRQLSPSDDPGILALLGADTGYLSLEMVGVDYPGISPGGMTRSINGQTVMQLPAAGYVTWLSSAGLPQGVGTRLSGGMVADFNWTYDGTVLPGWQLTPGVTYFRALFGETPSFAATYMNGAQSANLYLLLNQNPTVWQAGLNYATYFGGSRAWSQPYRDRGFVGAFVTRNF